MYVAMYMAIDLIPKLHIAHPCYGCHFGGHNCIGAYGYISDWGGSWEMTARLK